MNAGDKPITLNGLKAWLPSLVTAAGLVGYSVKIEAKVEAHEKALSALASRIDARDLELYRLSGDMAAMRATLEALKDSLARIEKKLDK